MLGISHDIYPLIDQCIQQLIELKKNKRLKTKAATILAAYLDTFGQLAAFGLKPQEIIRLRQKYCTPPWQGLAPLCSVKKQPKEKMAAAFFDSWIDLAPSYV